MSYLSAIRDNAFRLYGDAVLLFENERYASSIAMSILSIEEVGKFLILDDNDSEINKRVLQDHNIKQSALSQRYWTDLWMSLSREIPSALQMKRLAELRSLGLLEEASPTLTETSDQINEIFEELIRQKAPELLIARYMISTGVGDTVKAKNQALYVDLGPNNEILNDPSQLSSSEAEQWLRQADRALIEIRYDE